MLMDAITTPFPDMGAFPSTLTPFTLSASSFPPGRLRVLSFRGRETASRPFRFDLAVAVRSTDAPDLEHALLGQPATLAVEVPDGDPGSVCGIIASVEAQDVLDQDRHAFHLRLVPRMWLLGKRKTSRIFQNMTVPEIAGAVLDAARVPYRRALVETYQARTYCVQYQETDLAFVTRLLAEEGIFYVFEHGPGDTVVLCDNVNLHDPIAGDPRLAYRYEQGSDGLLPDEHHVGRFALRRTVKPGAVLQRDYDFRRPMLDVRAEAKPASSAPPDGSPLGEDVLPFEAEQLRVYDHHGEDEEPDVASGTARVRLEQQRRRALVAQGASACRRLSPGLRFELVDHEIDALNRSYVVARIEHHGRAPEVTRGREPVYTNTFACLPADVALRPKRPARKIQQVMETAVVVGPAGEEIYTDEHGRVKVQFFWDLEGKRNEYSSCWVRVSQAWAGPGWGSQYLPRIGMEVVVTFLGGDTDRPLITGCVPNAVNVPPFALPRDKTRSGVRTQSSPGGGGFNELSFEDRAGCEQIHLHAQRDLDEVVERNHTLWVRGDERLQVLGTRTDLVAGNIIARVGRNVDEHVGGDRCTQVEGNHIDVVSGNRDERVSGMRVTRIEGRERCELQHNADMHYAEDLTTTVNGCMTTLVGKEEARRSWVTRAEGTVKLSSLTSTEVSSDGELVLRVGKSSIRITADAIEIQSPAVTVKGGGGGISASADGLSLSSKGDAQVLVEKKLVLKSKDGASLSMQREVKLDGEKILLNSPEQAQDAPPKDPEPPTKIELVDDDGNTLAYQRFLVTLDDGSEVSGMTDKDGKAEVDLKSGGTVTFPDAGDAKAA